MGSRASDLSIDPAVLRIHPFLTSFHCSGPRRTKWSCTWCANLALILGHLESMSCLHCLPCSELPILGPSETGGGPSTITIGALPVSSCHFPGPSRVKQPTMWHANSELILVSGAAAKASPCMSLLVVISWQKHWCWVEHSGFRVLAIASNRSPHNPLPLHSRAETWN